MARSAATIHFRFRLVNPSLGSSKRTTGSAGNTVMKKEKALWKEGSVYLPTRFIPVFPALPAVAPHPEFNSRLGFSKTKKPLG
jgi:hypothetical protein